MTAKLNIGIVGANAARGWAKDAHIPALATIPDVNVSAVSARSQEIADAAAQTFGADKAFDDSIALTKNADVDVVIVTVKVPEHRAIVLSALAAGKHVYCEWPLGRDVAEAEEMAEAARKAGVHVMIGLQGTIAPATRRAVDLIRNGAIGKLLALRVFSPTAGWAGEAPACYKYLNDKSTGATLATITGGHTLAMITTLIGDYSEVDARSSILRPKVRIVETGEVIERTCADHLLVIGKHESGCVSTLEIAGAQDLKTPFLLELVGSKGRISMTSNHPGGVQVGNLTLKLNGEEDSDLVAVSPQLVGPPSNVAELYSRFVRDIRTGSRTVPNFDDAVHLSRLLDAIDVASANGKRQFR
jgi:predicted dehydrogenase